MRFGRRLGLVLVLVAGVAGCGDDQQSPVVDAAPGDELDGPPERVSCDPVSADPCPDRQKCSYVEGNGRPGETICDREGEVENGGECEVNSPSGKDNCLSGQCLPEASSQSGICRAACVVGETCGAGQCVKDDKLFSDRDDVGLCILPEPEADAGPPDANPPDADLPDAN